MLNVELVPSTCWGSNLRQILSAKEWVTCQQYVYRRSRRRCEVCAGRGARWPVECHEVWHYDDERRLQTLVGLVALCPRCHQVKHAGLAEVRGEIHLVMQQLMRVNRWTEEQASIYLEAAFEVWALRSEHGWDLDTTWLGIIGLEGQKVAAADRRVWQG